MKYASLRQGLVGAWVPSFGPSGNTLLDRSGYGNHGTLTNMDAGTDWVGGRYGWALDFDGSNDYVAAGLLRGTAAEVTVSAFIKLGVVDTFIRFICGNSNAAGAVIETHLEVQNGNIGPLWGSGPYYRPATSTGLVVGPWYHVALTRWGSIGAWNAEVFIDGRSAFTGTTSINPGAADVWSIGRTGAYAGPFTTNFFGCIDDQRVYSRRLTLNEFRLLATEPGIGLKPERTSVFFGAQLFNAAWAKNSNQLVSAGVI